MASACDCGNELSVSTNTGNLIAEGMIASQEGLFSTVLVVQEFLR